MAAAPGPWRFDPGALPGKQLPRNQALRAPLGPSQRMSCAIQLHQRRQRAERNNAEAPGTASLLPDDLCRWFSRLE
jgi:hypothetical protein